jgi:hypothetical protein
MQTSNLYKKTFEMIQIVIKLCTSQKQNSSNSYFQTNFLKSYLNTDFYKL